MQCLRDNRAHEAVISSCRSIPRADERLHVTTGAGSQPPPDAERTRALGVFGRLTRPDGDFGTIANAHFRADAST